MTIAGICRDRQTYVSNMAVQLTREDGLLAWCYIENISADED